MQVKVEDSATEPKFEPVTLTITIESKEELLALRALGSNANYVADRLCVVMGETVLPNLTYIKVGDIYRDAFNQLIEIAHQRKLL